MTSDVTRYRMLFDVDLWIKNKIEKDSTNA
jgi:hypothetical protein